MQLGTCKGCGAELDEYGDQCGYCGTPYYSEKAEKFKITIKEAEDLLTETDKQLDELNKKNPSIILREEGETSEMYAARVEKGRRYGRIRTSLSPIFFFLPIVWFLWDVVGATVCRIFSIDVAGNNKKYFSPIFDRNWLIRFGIIVAFYTILYIVDEKILRKAQVGK
ncbi:hypothetical protein [Mucilaginibacter ginsenosidivorax]|uniref:Uncharacterized protein n=1 Tax=Mucilaginibacter ginsenosidivorax TaxID=862126 RepID=A0A5B8VTR2_9SPHI|nr:hypothetical protein [Mucilaginibacter ginsenosidivorax]QEC74541.1 hypothetical protein FSB76_00710 [Mucilaginibacter ginsenosidivorax]